MGDVGNVVVESESQRSAAGAAPGVDGAMGGHDSGRAVSRAVGAVQAVASKPEKIPGSIVKAVCSVKSTVEAVKKSNRNQHGNYNFASTDDIYAATTRKMGDVGLMIMVLEDVCEIKRVEKDGKTSQWAHMEFSFVLATQEDTWSDTRARRSLYIQVTGAQTFQAAQSYAEKAFLRSLFKLPTGDMDLDSMPQDETEEGQIELSAHRKKKSSSAAKKDGTDTVFNEIRGAISGSDDIEALHRIRKDSWAVWSTMPERWRQILDEEFSDRAREFDVSA